MSKLRQEVKKSNELQKDLLRDFDILAQGTDQQEQLYEKADFEKAVEMTWSNLVLDNQGNKYSMFCDISEFKKYGPGIYLLFKFLKWASVVLFFCCLLSGINMMVILANNYLEQQGIYTGSNLQATFVKTTIANLSYEKYNSVIGVDFLITIILTISLIFWKEKQTAYIVQCSHFFLLSSYSTVILQKIPQDYNQHQIQLFLAQHYGGVKQIFTVKDFGDDIHDYKELTDILDDYKEERALVKMDEQRTSQQLTKLFFEFRHKYTQIKEKIEKKKQEGEGYKKYRPIFAFISFYEIQVRQHVLNDSNPFCYYNLYKGFREWQFANLKFLKSKKAVKTEKQSAEDGQDQQKVEIPQYKGHKLNFRQCFMQPNSILWQNLNISSLNRFLRMIVQVTILLAILFVSIIVIFMLSVFQNTMYDQSYKDMTKQQILILNNPQALVSFCLNLSTRQFFYDQFMLCSKYTDKYVKLTTLVLVIPLIISLLKFILTEAMKATVTFRRFKYEVDRIESQMLIVFAIYFFATALLQIFLSLEIVFQGNDFTLSFVNLIFPITQQLFSMIEISINNTALFQDFTRNWYSEISGRVILISIMSFPISAVVKIAYHWARSLGFEYMAKRQKIQLKMNYWMSGDFLQLQFIYAMAITIVYFTLMFYGPMPIVLISGALSMFLLYWSTKICFVKYCAKPMLYNHKINSSVVKIIFIGIIFHCIITPIFFGVAIGRENDDRQSSQNTSTVVNILWRLITYWYYFIVIGMALVYLFLRNFLHLLWLKLLRKIAKISIFQSSKNIKTVKDDIQKSNPVWNSNQLQEKHNKRTQNIQDGYINDKNLGPQVQGQLAKQSTKIQRHKFSLPSQLCLMAAESINQPRYSMHQHQEYKNILKTLYTVDSRQRCRNTFVFDQQLGNFISRDKDKNYKLFEEIIQFVKKDQKKYRPKIIAKIKNKGADCDDLFNLPHNKEQMVLNPFEKNKKKLEQIYRNSRNGENSNKSDQMTQFFRKLSEQAPKRQTSSKNQSNLLPSLQSQEHRKNRFIDRKLFRDSIKEQKSCGQKLSNDDPLEAPRSDQRIATYCKQNC